MNLICTYQIILSPFFTSIYFVVRCVYSSCFSGFHSHFSGGEQ